MSGSFAGKWIKQGLESLEFKGEPDMNEAKSSCPCAPAWAMSC